MGWRSEDGMSELSDTFARMFQAQCTHEVVQEAEATG